LNHRSISERTLVLASVFGGRLPPSEWYPAHDDTLSVRMLALRTGERARVVEGGPVDGAPVLLVHGWGCSAYFYRRIIPTLMSEGRRVMALDLRGHGASDKPADASLYTADAMCDFVVAAMDALEIGRTAVVAHSLGGGIAMDLAVRAPERVSSLALLAPVGLAPMRCMTLARVATPLAAAHLVPYAVPRWSIPLLLRGAYGSLGEYASRDVDEYWAPTADPAFALALRALLHAYRFEPRSDEELTRLQAPTLVLLGARDLLVRSGASYRRVSRIPNSRAYLIDRAGHVLAEEAPAAVLAQILPHLAAFS
jgi:pimeloyl-ACP methyl ester carboxylesterase